MSTPSRKDLAVLAALVIVVGGGTQWWAGRQEATLGAQVAAIAKPGDIRMLASETCAICASARVWFTEHRIPFSECMIERDADCRAAFQASTSPGTPVLLVRGRTLMGFSPTLVREALS